jgi:hypothetical protein
VPGRQYNRSEQGFFLQERGKNRRHLFLK